MLDKGEVMVYNGRVEHLQPYGPSKPNLAHEKLFCRAFILTLCRGVRGNC